jgi:hypothetical protein
LDHKAPLLFTTEKKVRKLGLLAAFLMASFGFIPAGTAFAAGEGLLSDTGISVTGDMAYYSVYEWRGFLLDGKGVFQPGIYVAGPSSKFGKLTAKFWASEPLSQGDIRQSKELDSILDYTYDFPAASVSFGHTYYSFPQLTPSDGAPGGFSREFYTGLTLPKVFLTPSVFFYRDYGSKSDGGGQGNYLVANLAYSMPVTLKSYACSLDLAGHYGYNYHQYIAGKGGDLGLSAGFTVPLTKSMTLTPGVNFAAPLGKLKKATDGNQKDRFYTGVTLKYSF